MEPVQSVRVDKWLWAARVFKTRSLAADACDGGKVDVNDQAVKPAKSLHPGDLIRVTLPQGRNRAPKVSALGDRRGPPAVARTLLRRSHAAGAAAAALGAAAVARPGTGRPTKRERRQLDHLRGA